MLIFPALCAWSSGSEHEAAARGLPDTLTRLHKALSSGDELFVLTPEVSPSHCPGDSTGHPTGPSD